MKPHKEYRSAIVFCWWPTPVWCADYVRDGGVWLRRAEKRTYRNGRVKFFRIGEPKHEACKRILAETAFSAPEGRNSDTGTQQRSVTE